MDHGAEDDVGEAPLKAAHGFFVGLAGGSFALVVVPARGRSLDLCHGHEMQRVVQMPVPGPRQAMPLDVTGGHFYEATEQRWFGAGRAPTRPSVR